MESKNIPRNQLITMIGSLRAVLTEAKTVFGEPVIHSSRVDRILKQTDFDVSEGDLVDGGFAELGSPRRTIAELAEKLHQKWQSQATWTRPQDFESLTEGEQCRWLELARWMRNGGKD